MSIRVAALIFMTVLLISNIGDIPNISHSKANKDVPFVRRGRVERERAGGRTCPFWPLFLSLCVLPPSPLTQGFLIQRRLNVFTDTQCQSKMAGAREMERESIGEWEKEKDRKSKRERGGQPIWHSNRCEHINGDPGVCAWPPHDGSINPAGWQGVSSKRTFHSAALSPCSPSSPPPPKRSKPFHSCKQPPLDTSML